MKSGLLLGFLALLAGCSRLRRPAESGGMVWNPIDSTLADSVHLVHFGRARGAIFPAAYERMDSHERRFTPSPELIRHVEPAIRAQYRQAWVDVINGYLNDTNLYRPPLTPAARRAHIAERLPWITREAERLPRLDRQYLGFYSRDGERMLLINLIDFSKDPHGLRPHLAESWVDGWHGWFDMNVRRVHFNLDQGRLSVH